MPVAQHDGGEGNFVCSSWSKTQKRVSFQRRSRGYLAVNSLDRDDCLQQCDILPGGKLLLSFVNIYLGVRCPEMRSKPWQINQLHTEGKWWVFCIPGWTNLSVTGLLFRPKRPHFLFWDVVTTMNFCLLCRGICECYMFFFDWLSSTVTGDGFNSL